MTMLEAMKLAQEQGKRGARPVCWRRHHNWFVNVHPPDSDGSIVDLRGVCSEEEIFGEWEVVE